MAWNWKIPGWPEFRYDTATLAPLEQRFLLSAGEILGAVHHVSPSERDQLRIDLLSDEAALWTGHFILNIRPPEQPRQTVEGRITAVLQKVDG